MSGYSWHTFADTNHDFIAAQMLPLKLMPNCQMLETKPRHGQRLREILEVLVEKGFRG